MFRLAAARSLVARAAAVSRPAARQISTSAASQASAARNMRAFLPLALGVGAVGLYAAHQTLNNPVAAANKKAHAGQLNTNSERSYIMIKPDGVQRGLVGEIITRFERKGYKLVALKLLTPSKEHAAKHYDDLKTKPFFKGLVDYMSCGTPVVAMVWEGKGVIKTGRIILGTTNPSDSAPGTIRGDYAISIGRNIIHGSDSHESANDEIGLWFTDAEINEWSPALSQWIASDN